MAARNVNNNINSKSTRPAENLSREASLLTSNFRDRERIKGYVDEETLWKLQKSLIGYTAVESDTIRIQDNLCRWGLGEIKIKKMAWRMFLIEVEDDDLYNSLKDSGENVFQMSGVEKMTILISTSQIEKIESIIDIEVGKELFPENNVGAQSTGVEQVVEEVEMVSPLEGNVGPVASWAETIEKLNNDLSHTQEQGNDSTSHS
ncbi:hypothetical protein V6N13_025740 [Hibiscus sabdariffa]